MYLTISKRFDMSSAARLFCPDWDEDKNLAVYGPGCRGEHGHGYNFVARFVFHGPIDEKTGMMLNVRVIKERAGKIIDGRYDHKYLNVDTPPFTDLVPTPENLAVQLLAEITPLFDDQPARPVICHFQDSHNSAATAYTDGHVDRNFWLDMSAARRTFSPHLSDEENEALFGIASAASGHGHNYRLRVTLSGRADPSSGLIVPYEQSSRALKMIHDELDHKNLNTDVPGLKGLPMTTETLTRYIAQRLGGDIPVSRVKLYELPHFFSEYTVGGKFLMGVTDYFHAAHRLHSPYLNDEENCQVYGICNNPNGHGHEYKCEATIGGEYDERSGTLYDLAEFQNAIRRSLALWDYKHLELDTDDFTDTPSTGENIITRLWPRLDEQLDNRLHRLRLWETPNNRFALRRSK